MYVDPSLRNMITDLNDGQSCTYRMGISDILSFKSHGGQCVDEV
jgi:hypothetical protein